MQKILLFGAGRSATDLIDYLNQCVAAYDWKLTIVDAHVADLQEKFQLHANVTCKQFDIMDRTLRQSEVQSNELVISLLPAFLHIEVARDCLEFEKHLLTASYMTQDLQELAAVARTKALIFMGELGLDPGLDHMSAMEIIDRLKGEGAEIIGFKSYTGGLISAESDSNPWHYKISWNPRNIVLAGRGVAQFLKDGAMKYIPYTQLFQRHDIVEVYQNGKFEMYPNRDSMPYREKYGLLEVQTLVRGTLRHIGFCHAWSILVQLGLTDDELAIDIPEGYTYADWTASYLPAFSEEQILKDQLGAYFNIDANSEILYQLEWLGLFDEIAITRKSAATSAQILEDLLVDKLKLYPEDKDLVVMQHEFEYRIGQFNHVLESALVCKGKDSVHTAMSKLVGTPLAIFAKLVMLGQITQVEYDIPVEKQVYLPILEELHSLGISFKEQMRNIG